MGDQKHVILQKGYTLEIISSDGLIRRVHYPSMDEAKEVIFLIIHLFKPEKDGGIGGLCEYNDKSTVRLSKYLIEHQYLFEGIASHLPHPRTLYPKMVQKLFKRPGFDSTKWDLWLISKIKEYDDGVEEWLDWILDDIGYKHLGLTTDDDNIRDFNSVVSSKILYTPEDISVEEIEWNT